MELHPILFIVFCHFVATFSKSSKETPRGTRIVATVAGLPVDIHWLPQWPEASSLAIICLAACHVRARRAGDVPDGNDALWSLQEFLEPNATTMGTSILM